MTAPMSRDASVGELPVVAWMDDLGSIIFDPRNSRCSRPETFKHDLTTVAAARECIAAQSAMAEQLVEALRKVLNVRAPSHRYADDCELHECHAIAYAALTAFQESKQ